MRRDPVLEKFLERQLQIGQQLSQDSTLLDLMPAQQALPSQYLAHFKCQGLVLTKDDQVVEADSFLVRIRFPRTYLQIPNQRIVSWMGPRNVFHPNLFGPAEQMCIGDIPVGTPLDFLLEQCFRVITYQKLTMREDDALDARACVWARRNQHRFPIDPRPLRCQIPVIRAEVIDGEPEQRRC